MNNNFQKLLISQDVRLTKSQFIICFLVIVTYWFFNIKYGVSTQGKSSVKDISAIVAILGGITFFVGNIFMLVRFGLNIFFNNIVLLIINYLRYLLIFYFVFALMFPIEVLLWMSVEGLGPESTSYFTDINGVVAKLFFLFLIVRLITKNFLEYKKNTFQ